MSEDNPSYVGWRAQELALLAISRMAGWKVIDSPADSGVDLEVTTESGKHFLVQVKGGSSFLGPLKGMKTEENLKYTVDKRVLEAARSKDVPVVLFVFDADAEAGRFLPLHEIDIETGPWNRQSIELPKRNLISTESLKKLEAELPSK